MYKINKKNVTKINNKNINIKETRRTISGESIMGIAIILCGGLSYYVIKEDAKEVAEKEKKSEDSFNIPFRKKEEESEESLILGKSGIADYFKIINEKIKKWMIFRKKV